MLKADRNLLLQLFRQSPEERKNDGEDVAIKSSSRPGDLCHSQPTASSSSSPLGALPFSSSSSEFSEENQELPLGLESDKKGHGIAGSARSRASDAAASTDSGRSRVSLEQGGVACGFYRCSLVASHCERDPRRLAHTSGEEEEEREEAKFEGEEDEGLQRRDFGKKEKLAVIVDFTTFPDLSGPTDIFLSMKYRHILLSDYSLVSLVESKEGKPDSLFLSALSQSAVIESLPFLPVKSPAYRYLFM